jgi:uncharacterized protein (TIGR04551 family)
MPKASLAALLAASAVTVVPLTLFAQAAPAPGGTPPAVSAPASERPAAEAPAAPNPPDEAADAAEPHSAAGAPAQNTPQPAAGPLLPGMAYGATPEPVSVAQPKSSASANENKADTTLAEDWWSHSRPIIEIHGNFRTRAEMFHNFSLGRVDAPGNSIWPRPTDTYYSGFQGTSSTRSAYGPTVCGSASSDKEKGCSNKTQSSANLRLRLNPEIHVSDNLRIMTQIDILDNVVLGSTPSGYATVPSSNGGYTVYPRNGYTPLSFFDNTTEVPSAGVNGFKDSVRVKRAWAEYSTPLGQLRFGRMPDHFGLGMLHNAGDGYDHDYQSTIDRLQFITDIRPLDLYVGASWDFPSEGRTSESLSTTGGQPYDVAQLDDVKQYSFLVLRRKSPQLQRASLSRGDAVFNFGAYVTYRKQYLAMDDDGANCSQGGTCTYSKEDLTFARRNAYAWTPDLWGQILYKGFRFEMEAATIQGQIDGLATTSNATDYLDEPGGRRWRLNAWGVATQLQQKLLEDRLDLSFGFGWASGDPDVDKGGSASSEAGNMGLTPGSTGLQRQRGDNVFSTFRFHPSYQMDLILHRNLLTRVQGTYYFRPSIGYDFLRRANGQRLGGNVAGIWTRASEFTQAPGHERDLGIELNGSVYFQSKDGVLNDQPGTLGGFFTMLQYGVLFPLDGMGYPNNVKGSGTSAAQILRWYMGVFF